jgi:hypothetical protein
MSQDVPEKSVIDALNKQYGEYIGRLKTSWLSENRMRSGEVYEVMRSEERAEVHRRIAAWGRYITPFAEAWWKERGYGIVWPDDNSKPMQIYRLQAA